MASLSLSLLLAIVGLLVGPVMASLWPRGRSWRVAVDGLALLLVAGLCIVEIVPHAIEAGGALAVGVGLVVLALGVVVRRLPKVGRGWTMVAYAVICVHAFFDGTALVVLRDEVTGLGLAIAAHRLPVGLALFTAAAHQGRPGLGWLAVAGLGAMTIVGAFAGVPIAAQLSPELHGAIEAAVAAALLHVVFHRHDSAAPDHAHTHGHEHSGSDRSAPPARVSR